MGRGCTIERRKRPNAQLSRGLTFDWRRRLLSRWRPLDVDQPMPLNHINKYALLPCAVISTG